MVSLVVIYHSGHGHTQRAAEAVSYGAKRVAGVSPELITIGADGVLPSKDFDSLNAADAIIFGSPTYMGTVSWQFKRFAEATSGIWSSQGWKDKVAAAFTNSAAMNGDKHSSIAYMITLAMQHGMIWVGTGMLPASKKASTRNDINYLGAFSGAMTQSPADASVEEMLPGDLETARLFGQRIAEMTLATRSKVLEIRDAQISTN